MKQKFLEGYKGRARELDPEFMELLKTNQIILRQRKIGKYEIKIVIIPAGKEMTVVSARNWYLMGYKRLNVRYDMPRLLFKLLRDGKRLLMSDSPQEMFLQYKAYQNAKGRVLIGGLGLGLFANMIANKKEVTEIIVVEIDKDIIKLCKPKNKKIKVVHGDIWEFIKTTDEKFDYAYVDIHYSTGCMEYLKTVLPMRKILEKRFPDMPVDFWGEEEMESQYDPDWDKKVAKIKAKKR